MIDYSNWKKEKSTLITNLHLDPNNPRIPIPNLSQSALLAELIEHDDVYGLAKSIVSNGYLPGEQLIIVREHSKKVVIEGNRRLAAVKVLLSPESAPMAWQSKFKHLSGQTNTDIIKKVPVIEAPNRIATHPIVLSRHTLPVIEKWSTIMQSKFYKNIIDSGLSVNEISSTYGISPSEVTDALQSLEMYEIACALTLPSNVAMRVHDPRKFPVTTLDRFYRNSTGKKFLGIDFDDNKQLVGNIDIEEFQKRYGKVVSDIALNNADSRTFHSSTTIRKYFEKENLTERPDPNKKGRFTITDFYPSAENKTVPLRPVSQKKSQKRKKSVALIPRNFHCTCANERINDICSELKKLRVADYPNAVSILFRSLLEMSTSYYLNKTEHLDLLRQQIETKKRRREKSFRLPRDWHPTLKEMLTYITNNTEMVKGNQLKALKKFITQSHSSFSLDSMNQFVHNEHLHPSEGELRNNWNQLYDIFEIILKEPQ